MPNRIREWRERRQLTQQELADRCSTTKMQISRLERGQRRLTQGWMERLGTALACHPAELLPLSYPQASAEPSTPAVPQGGSGPAPGGPRAGEVRPAEDHEPVAPGDLPRDIAVLGTSRGGAAGGESGDFQMNGQVVDHVRRPPGIAGLRDVFALYVVGESMSPWREPGDLVYVSGTRQPRSGDYVVAELHPDEPDGPPQALLKRLAGRSGERLVLEQYNPRITLQIEQRRVRQLYRVIDWPELLGV